MIAGTANINGLWTGMVTTAQRHGQTQAAWESALHFVRLFHLTSKLHLNEWQPLAGSWLKSLPCMLRYRRLLAWSICVRGTMSTNKQQLADLRVACGRSERRSSTSICPACCSATTPPPLTWLCSHQVFPCSRHSTTQQQGQAARSAASCTCRRMFRCSKDIPFL